MKIYKEWLADDDNNIIYKPLSFWFEHFGIKPLTINGEAWHGYELWKTGTGKRIDIEISGGQGLLWNEYETYKDKLFFVGNADLDVHKLREKF